MTTVPNSGIQERLTRLSEYLCKDIQEKFTDFGRILIADETKRNAALSVVNWDTLYNAAKDELGDYFKSSSADDSQAEAESLATRIADAQFMAIRGASIGDAKHWSILRDVAIKQLTRIIQTEFYAERSSHGTVIRYGYVSKADRAMNDAQDLVDAQFKAWYDAQNGSFAVAEPRSEYSVSYHYWNTLHITATNEILRFFQAFKEQCTPQEQQLIQKELAIPYQDHTSQINAWAKQLVAAQFRACCENPRAKMNQPAPLVVDEII